MGKGASFVAQEKNRAFRIPTRPADCQFPPSHPDPFWFNVSVFHGYINYPSNAATKNFSMPNV